MKKPLFFVSFLAIACLLSCNKNLENPGWKTEALSPIAKTSLSVKNLSSQDSSVVVNPDSSVTIVHTEEVYNFANPLDSLVTLTIAPFEREITLQSLELSSQSISDTTFLGELVEEMGMGVFLYDGASVPAFLLSAIPDVQVDPTTVDVTEFFESADLTQGYLDLTVENQLPLVITSLEFEIRNEIDSSLVYSNTYSNIFPGQTVVDTGNSLAGKSIQGNLSFEIINLSFEVPPPAIDPVIIDYSDFAAFNLGIRDIKVSEATAIFPSQNVVDETDTVSLRGMDDVELTFAKIETGTVTAHIFSTLPTKLHLYYEIPSATLAGESFKFNTTVPEALTPDGIEHIENFSLENHDFDLTGMDGTLVNTFFNTVLGRIDSTGDIITLSLQDTLFLELAVKDIVPSYVLGYMGQFDETIPPDTIPIDVFNTITGGSLNVETAKFVLRIDNGLGMPGDLTIERIDVENSKTNDNASVSGLPKTVNVLSASEPAAAGDGFNASSTVTEFNNVQDLINVLPDEVVFGGNLQINPNGNVPMHSNFMYKNSFLKSYLDIEVPLGLQANMLEITDTVDFSLSELEYPSDLQEGTLFLLAENGFPLEAKIDLYLADEDGDIIDSLTSPDLLTEADVNGQLRVVESKESTLAFDVSTDKIESLWSAQKIIFVIRFDSRPDGAFVKLYDDYLLELQLTGKFGYNVNLSTDN